MSPEVLEEKIYPIEDDSARFKYGDTFFVNNSELKLGAYLFSGWRFVYNSSGEGLLYYEGNRELLENFPKSSMLPEVLYYSENEVVIADIGKLRYKQYKFVKPSKKEDINKIVGYLSDIAKLIKNFKENNLSVLYINPDSINIDATNTDTTDTDATDLMYNRSSKIKLKIFPDVCEINKEMYSSKDMVAPEVLRRRKATGKEGVYVLGLLCVKFLLGKNLHPYDDISVLNCISDVDIPGFPQFLSKTLAYSNERFTIEEAIDYLKNIAEEMKMPVKFDIGMSSTVGLNIDRLIDEDSCGFVIENTLNSGGKVLSIRACLADGMGGMAAGEVASKAAVNAFLKTGTDLSAGFDTAADDINSLALNMAWQANKNVFDFLEGKDGGCTFIGVVIKNENFALVHAGDSRAYLWTGSKPNPELIRLTNDHSYVALMVSSGNMTEEEAKNSPDRNKIVKSLGAVRNRQEGYIDDLQKTIGKKTEVLKNNDILILVCDGIWSEIGEDGIISILNRCKTTVNNNLNNKLSNNSNNNLNDKLSNNSNNNLSNKLNINSSNKLNNNFENLENNLEYKKINNINSNDYIDTNDDIDIIDAQYIADLLVGSAVKNGASDNASALIIKRTA
ncbi:MAG: serine/threonine-protein phosphatase [Candidatus Acididesulfobacter guangdongensis]|uniref:Serine/threonine-protein phosphatase n=1 Tax=Acididesulfobacter guangdongensis TaxID=2597225 RepID=A0A519BFB0_ACIG2|nr:MAG: serine/threonine-protein phosphatase [Candidatus Acididesulfobacter guangdongensis]